MKKLLLILVLLFSIHSIYAQNSTDSVVKPKIEYRKNIFSFYPLGLIGNSLLVSFERRITTENALRGVFGFGSAENTSISNLNNLLELYGEIQFRIYPIQLKKDKLNYGFFVAPYFLAKHRSFSREVITNIPTGQFTYIDKRETINTAQSAISGGVVVGYNYVFLERISLDFYLGGGMMYVDVKTPNDVRDLTINEYSNGVKLQIGLSVGISF